MISIFLFKFSFKGERGILPASLSPVLRLIFIGWIFCLSFLHASDAPRRIVSLAPHITEIIFKLGAGDHLVGRTDFCTYPPEAKKIPSVGGYLNTDYEAIVRLHPDLILQFPNPESRAKLEALGFRVEEIPNETVPDILNGITTVGRLLHCEERAQAVQTGIEDTLKAMQKQPLPAAGRVSAILVVGRQPGSLQGLYLAGRETYLSQIWEMCGGVNAFADVSSRYFPVGKEDLLKRPVDAILEFHSGWELTPSRRKSERRVWSVFSALSAVQKGQIYLFSQSYFVIPGPRISRIAVSFSGIIREIRRGEQ